MIIEFESTLDWNLSKNKKFVGRQSKVLSTGYKKARYDIAWLCKMAIKREGIEFTDKKEVIVSIMVFKKNHVGDCINLIEGICDAIKEVIKVDDRYFSIGFCRWNILEKENKNQKILIRIEQDDN